MYAVLCTKCHTATLTAFIHIFYILVQKKNLIFFWCLSNPKPLMVFFSYSVSREQLMCAELLIGNQYKRHSADSRPSASLVMSCPIEQVCSLAFCLVDKHQQGIATNQYI